MYPGRLAIQQRVLPEYRVSFFDTLTGLCAKGLGVFTGQPLRQEGISTGTALSKGAYTQAHNRNFRDPGSALYLCWQDGILRWLEEQQPDALVVEANWRLLSTRLAVQWMQQRGKPVLGWGLGAPPVKGVLGKLHDWQRTAFLKSLDGWIAYSRGGAQEYRGLGLDPKRVFAAGNAVTPKPVSPPPERGIPGEGGLQVLFVGRLQRRKRIDLLLQACASLPEALQPRLILTGDGPDRAEMEAQARAWYPRAEFIGEKHGEALENVFRSADLFVLPGTGGLAVQQAMSHGLPVIVAQGDGTQADLVRPENGWLVRPDDGEALGEALRQALANPEGLRQMGKESYRIVRDEINLERMAEVFVEAVQAAGG